MTLSNELLCKHARGSMEVKISVIIIVEGKCNFQIMPRSQGASAIVNAGFLYKLDNEEVQLARLAYGGLSSTFIRAAATEKYLTGKELFKNHTLRMALHVLKVELKVVEMPPEPSAASRKQLAINLFYKVKGCITVLFVNFLCVNHVKL